VKGNFDRPFDRARAGRSLIGHLVNSVNPYRTGRARRTATFEVVGWPSVRPPDWSAFRWATPQYQRLLDGFQAGIRRRAHGPPPARMMGFQSSGSARRCAAAHTVEQPPTNPMPTGRISHSRQIPPNPEKALLRASGISSGWAPLQAAKSNDQPHSCRGAYKLLWPPRKASFASPPVPPRWPGLSATQCYELPASATPVVCVLTAMASRIRPPPSTTATAAVHAGPGTLRVDVRGLCDGLGRALPAPTTC